MGEWYTWVMAIVLGVGLGLYMNKNKNTNKDAITVLSKDDFYNNMRKGQLVDVRKKKEFEVDKIKGARNFTVSQLTSKYPKIRLDQSVYLYANTENKAKSIAKKMSRKGYKAIYILESGFTSKK